MLIKDIKVYLNSLNIKELILTQRKYGRREVPGDFRTFWCGVHEQVVEFLGHEDPRIKEQANLVHILTESLVELREDPLPEYYVYTEGKILDWYLGDLSRPFMETKKLILQGQLGLLEDLERFESGTLAGTETSNQERVDREVIEGRLVAIRKVKADLENAYGNIFRGAKPVHEDLHIYDNPADFIEEPTRISGLVHLSCFPQTPFHDEVLFLKAIHISELTFLGVRLAVQEAVRFIMESRQEYAAYCLWQCMKLMTVLHHLFLIVKTMPPAHFLDFREATGYASAVKSYNFQLMEIALRGLNPAKKPVLDKIGHLQTLEQDHGRGVSLKAALSEVRGDLAEWRDVFEVARKLDRHWSSWRGLHLSLAKTHLAGVAGTGDTEGAPYLEKFLPHGIFDDGPVSPYNDPGFMSLSELSSRFGAPSFTGIVPATI